VGAFIGTRGGGLSVRKNARSRALDLTRPSFNSGWFTNFTRLNRCCQWPRVPGLIQRPGASWGPGVRYILREKRDVEVRGKQDVPESRPVGWGWTVVRGRGLSHCQCVRERDRGAQARQIRPFPPSIEQSASQASSSTSQATAAAPRSTLVHRDRDHRESATGPRDPAFRDLHGELLYIRFISRGRGGSDPARRELSPRVQRDRSESESGGRRSPALRDAPTFAASPRGLRRAATSSRP